MTFRIQKIVKFVKNLLQTFRRNQLQTLNFTLYKVVEMKTLSYRLNTY